MYTSPKTGSWRASWKSMPWPPCERSNQLLGNGCPNTGALAAAVAQPSGASIGCDSPIVRGGGNGYCAFIRSSDCCVCDSVEPFWIVVSVYNNGKSFGAGCPLSWLTFALTAVDSDQRRPSFETSAAERAASPDPLTS